MQIRVSHILALLACGAPQTDVLEDDPILGAAAIAAVLDFAARQRDHPQSQP